MKILMLYNIIDALNFDIKLLRRKQDRDRNSGKVCSLYGIKMNTPFDIRNFLYYLGIISYAWY